MAAIDFGTNTARLLVAERNSDGTFGHLRIEREIVRMGGGFSKESGLSTGAMERGSNCLTRFSEILKGYDVSTVRAVATSAVRDAVNGSDFIASIAQQTGIHLTVIDGVQEGALTLAGVMAGLDCVHDNLMVFDVGGGSTEYTLACGGHPAFIKSLPMGVVRLTEGKITPEEITKKISKELDLLAANLTSAGRSEILKDSVLVGTAGTATTLAAINMKMVDYDYRKVNNYRLSLNDIKAMYAELLPLSPEKRIAIPGLEKGREDLIIAGCLITIHTMERFEFSAMKVSDYGLLEGLIVEEAF